MPKTVTISEAQDALSELCRTKEQVVICNREKPVRVLLSIEDYEAMQETMDLLSNHQAMRVLRAAKTGKLKYRKLDLSDDNFGL
jgi:prevent-host-death family protein